MAGRIKYGYPATRYRTMHPDDVDPSDIAKKSGEEFNDHLVALNIVLDYRAIPVDARPLSQLWLINLQRFSIPLTLTYDKIESYDYEGWIFE